MSITNKLAFILDESNKNGLVLLFHLDYHQIHNTKTVIRHLIVFKMCKTYTIHHQTNRIQRWRHILLQRLQSHRTAEQITIGKYDGTILSISINCVEKKTRTLRIISINLAFLVFYMQQHWAIVDFKANVTIESIIFDSRWRREWYQFGCECNNYIGKAGTFPTWFHLSYFDNILFYYAQLWPTMCVEEFKCWTLDKLILFFGPWRYFDEFNH